MVAWYLFERDDVRARFLDGGEETQFAILDEILRLEPVAAMVHRRSSEDAPADTGSALRAGGRYAIDIRAVNTDKAAVGACPFALDPDRAAGGRLAATHLSFGDGAHRCPGASVALHETRVFIDRLMRVPGLRLERAPDMRWNQALASYELRNAVVSCDLTRDLDRSA